jgi:hypothetical protein
MSNRKHEFSIQYKGIGGFWTLRKPWTVFEYSYDGYLPTEIIFKNKKEAEQYVMLKKLEQ